MHSLERIHAENLRESAHEAEIAYHAKSWQAREHYARIRRAMKEDYGEVTADMAIDREKES